MASNGLIGPLHVALNNSLMFYKILCKVSSKSAVVGSLGVWTDVVQNVLSNEPFTPTQICKIFVSRRERLGLLVVRFHCMQ
jgi:hypothetical protein